MSFTTNWSPDGYNYFMNASEALPTNFRVVTTEKDTGVNQELQGSQLSQRLSNKYDVRPSIALRDGKVYRIEGFVGNASVGSREITAANTSLAEPTQMTVRATYSTTQNSVDNKTDARIESSLGATDTLDAVPHRVISKRTGTGTVNSSSPAYSSTITLTTVSLEKTNGNTTKALVVGQGPLIARGDAPGSGQTRMRSEFLGREMKGGRTGPTFLCEKGSTVSEVSVTVVTGGENVQVVNNTTEISWSRVDTGQVIWHNLTWSGGVTYQGTFTPDDGTLEEAPPADASAPKLTDIVVFSGFAPYPLVDGDSFLERGKENATIQYAVSDGGAKQAGGQSFATLKVTGTVAVGASGVETWYVIRDGSLTTLPISWTSHYQRGTETADSRGDLLAIA